MRISIFLVLALLVATFVSCDNDLNLITEKKDIPVVYGLLSISEEFQLIRIERAFVDEAISALELAQDPDQLYYPQLDVNLINEAGESLPFERIDGNVEGYPREDGVFATSPNTLYRAKTEDLNLVPGQTYTLQINRGDGLPLVEATTLLVDEPRIVRPTPAAKLDFDEVDDFKVSWRPAVPGLFDVVMHLNYFETTDTSNLAKTLTWVVANNIEGEELERDGNNFYTFLQGALNADERITRRFRNIDLEIVGGGEELLRYISVGQANLGITSSQDIPTYTNLSEGFGIFSSKAKATREGLALSKGTIDSLRFGRFTKQLNFR